MKAHQPAAHLEKPTAAWWDERMRARALAARMYRDLRLRYGHKAARDIWLFYVRNDVRKK